MADPVITYSGPIVSRKQAKESGLTRYFTGKPCPHGHVSQRTTSGTACVECVRLRRLANPDANYAAVKAWRAANPEKWAAQSKRYALRHPDKRRAASKRYIENNRDKVRAQSAEWQRQRRRNDPVGQRQRIARFKARRDAALAEIAGRPRPDACELCGSNEYNIVFDHCHRGGQFRGWICDRCNRVLGLVKDAPELLRAMANYLEASSGPIDYEKAKEPSYLAVCGAVAIVSD